MTHTDREIQLAAERQRIHAAAQRLLAGTSERSDGKLTISTLAIEAGIARQRLYEHHGDLVTEFRSGTGSISVSPNIIALQQQLADAQIRIRELEDQATERSAQIKTLRAIITELTHEAHADNIVTFPIARTTEP